MRRLLLAAALLAPALPAAGAAVSWSGAGDATSWGDPANWSPAGVPTAADAVVLVASGGVVTAGAGTMVLASSLDLGSGASSTTLRLSTGAAVTGLLRVRGSAVLTFTSTQPVSAGVFRVESGGLVDLYGPVSQATTAVTVSALLFDLQAGATVNVTARGFAGGEAITVGSGPGAGGSGTGGAGAGGAGHGAAGGNGGLSLNGGAAYGSLTAPASAGSGGGGGLAPCVGGAGGGLVTVAAVTATVSGLIIADGAGGVSNCSQAGGGGSGGAVNLTAYNLTGTGQVLARGGAGGNGLAGRGGGGGAGGRVALKTTGLNLSALTVTVTGGAGGGGAPTGTGGGSGTAFIDPKVWTGAGTADCKDAANWVASVAPLAGDNVVFGSTASAKSCTWDFGLLPAGSLTLESGYAGTLFWNTNLSSVTGRFLIAGGTLAVGSVDLRLGGDVQQAGGLVNVTGGTVTLAGFGKAVSLSSAALFNHLVVDTGASVTLSSLTVGGNFTVKAGATMSVQSGAVLRLRGHATQLGSVAPAGGTFLFEGTTTQAARWSDFGQLTSSNPAGVTLLPGPASTTAVLGRLSIEPGAALALSGVGLALGGDWVSSGSFSAGVGTVAFVGPGAQEIVCGATQFAYVQMASTAGASWSTAVTVSLGVTFSSGTTDLRLSTHSIRGSWTAAGGAFRGSSGTVVFDGGSRQPVQGGPGSAFGRFVSSNPAGVALTADALVEADLELRRGALDLSSRTVRVQGALRRQGGTAVSAASSSTVVLDGRALQDLSMAGGSLDALVVANSSAGVRLLDALVVRGTFTVLPGAVFDGLSSSISVVGASSAWASAGADYRSAPGGAHTVLWSAPAAGSLTVADGSTVAARVDVAGPVRLAGTLHIAGAANLLAVGAGATLDARAATVSLRGTSELWLSTGSWYRHDAGSWLVYAGSGTDRGLMLSTGPFGHVLFAPEDPAATLRLKSVFLDGGLTAATGTVRLQDPARLELKGDLRNAGGALDFGSAAGSTVAFAGTALQAYAPGAADDLPYLEVSGSSSVVPSAGSAVTVRRGTTLLSGTLQGSNARFWLSGDWTGRGGVFAAEASTASFVSAATQTYVDSSHQVFAGLAAGPGPRQWRSSFDAAVFTATHPATTLEFSTSGVHVVGTLTALSSSTASPVTLRGAAPGLAARFAVTRSTVSAAVLKDFDATAGSVAYADDGRSVDGGNTPGVEFRPFMLVLSPGESLVPGTGRAGAASAQTAGTTFTVTVAAVSDAFLPVAGASTTLTASSSDPFDAEPGTAALSGGQATFPFSLRRAEPAGLTVQLSAAGSGSAGVYGSTVTAQPAAFHTLQPLLPGEASQPGTPLGRGGVTDFQIAGRSFVVTVRAVDRFGNLTASVTDSASVSQVSGASATLPAAAALAAGSATLSGLVVHTTGLFTLTLVDVSSTGFVPAVSSTFSVFSLSAGSPTVNFSLPSGASVGTLSGNVGGGARDTVAVTEVAMALKDVATGLWFDWAGGFSQSSPVARNAVVTPFRGTDVSWSLPFDDSRLTTGRDYFAVVRASNPASFSTLSNSTFTFDRAILNFAPTDGEGSAAAVPASTGACQATAVGVTVTVGRSGVGRGGVLAVRVPPGWTPPAGLAPSSPAAPGYVAIVSTSLAWTAAGSSSVAFEPPAVGSVTLGAGWVTLAVTSAAPNTFLPGQAVTFQYTGFPPPGTLGRQVFEVRTRSAGSGTLVAVATAPAVTLAAGPGRALEFAPAGLLALGPLQASPTMQLRVTDGCGNSAPAPSTVTVTLDAGQAAPAGFSPDATAAYFSGGPATTTVSVASSSVFSAPFTFRTSTAGVSGLVLRASATVAGSAVQALRQALVRSSSVTASAVSIDSGTLAAGATSAVLVPGASGARAVVRFTVADAGVPWEVLVASEASFTSPLARAAGFGDPDGPQSAAWDAVVCGAVCSYVPPGRYPVRVSAGGNPSPALEVLVATTPFLAGSLGASGAGALVRAEGAGTGPGAAAQADLSGAYRVDGLRAGVLYALTASSAALVAGSPVVMTTAAYRVSASTSGGSPGPLALSRPAVIRVSASVPALSPEELFGVVTARRPDGSAAAAGALHFPRRGASSDDGGVAVGRAASTWTVLAVPPGPYALTLSLERLGVSTTAYVASASSSAFTDVAAAFPRRAAVTGTLALASTGAALVPVSVSASSAGASVPTRFATVTLPDSSALTAATAAFRLFGLDAGSWTLAARAPGFAAASTVVFVPGDDDVGDPVTGAGGPGLALAFGSVLRGTVTVSGDSRGLAGTGPDPTNLPAAGFAVLVEAYAPSSGRRETLAVALATSAAQTSAAFSLTGLDTGTWLVRSAVSGFEKSPGGPEAVSVSTAGGSVQLSFGAPRARARLSVVVPRPAAPCSCAADFAGLAFLHEPPAGPFEAVAAATGSAALTAAYSASSAAFTTGPLAPGTHRWTFLDRPSGRRAAAALTLAADTTAAATLDLTGATWTVTGSVLLGGTVRLSSGAVQVSASSMAAVAAMSARASYCLLASTAPVVLPAARVELVPMAAGLAPSPGPLTPAGASCAAWAAPSTAPVFARAAAVAADGSFVLTGVPAGTYRLRMPGDLDGRPGDEAAPLDAELTVSGDSSVTLTLAPGASLSGAARLPPGATGRRALEAVLTDREGRRVRAASFEAAAGSSAAFTLAAVPDGEFALEVRDAGFPRTYAARPRSVRVGGGAADAGTFYLELAGAVRGRLAAERRLASGAREVVLLTGADRTLLPPSLRIAAVASPWVEGGFVPASGQDCDALGCRRPDFDSEGRFTVQGLVPGVYDVELTPSGASAGADLAPAAVSGVAVAAGETVDLGVVRLRVAAALAGSLTDAAGGPPPSGVAVEARQSVPGAGGTRRPRPRAVSDAAGRFVLGGLDPDAPFYDVVASPRAEDASEPPAPWEQAVVSGVDVRSTTTVTLALRAASYSVSGSVAAEDGSALRAPADGAFSVPGARVWLSKSGASVAAGPLGELSVLTAPDGSFVIAGVGAGSYRLTAAAEGCSPKTVSVTVGTAAASVGTLTLSRAAMLSGSVRRPDGGAPGEDEVRRVYAATPDSSELVPGALVRDPAGRSVTGYRVGGFAPGRTYRLVLVSSDGEAVTPPEGAALVFASTAEARALDLVFRTPRPRVTARSRRSGSSYLVEFQSSQPLRARTTADDDLSVLLATVAARGTLSSAALSPDRRRLSAVYAPGVGESSFTLRFSARAAAKDPDAADGAEFPVVSTVAFYAGLDGYHETRLPNLTGGSLAVDGDAGRLVLPKGAFLTDASSTVAVALRRSDELLTGARSLAAAGLPASEAATKALRLPPAAYPADLLRALAATPPDVKPAGPYYDVALATTTPTRLARPARLTLAASAGNDPSRLNVYWYNEAANAFVLQQDAAGAALEVDAANRTVSLAVDHFSTFVLFDAAAAVISGNAFTGGELTAYNFPNPFDLVPKTVTPIHGAAAGQVRGTMIRLSVPPGTDGDARIMVFSVAGERVKTISLGTLGGGRTYYQPWDGTNDAGADVASGVYIGQAKVGGKSVFFKMAVIK